MRSVHRVPVLALVFFFALLLPSSALARETLKVVVPEKENLQYLVFWAAKGLGSFERQGIDLEISAAPPPSKGTPPIDASLEKGEIDAAVVAPSAYLRMIGAKAPVVVVANLFANDPYALVVRREVADARKLSPDAPVRDRIAGVKGMTIGYAPAAFGRLRSLLATQGLDIEKDVKATVLLARHQRAAFKESAIDAVYLASPHLEETLAGSGAMVLVNQARGEVPELANKQTNVLVVSRRVLETRRDVVVAAVRAIAEAEERIHSAQAEVVDALARELPGRDRAQLAAAVALYEPAVPRSPEVHAQDLVAALAVIPEGVPKPVLAGIDLAPFVASDLAPAAVATKAASRSIPWLAIGLGVFALFAIVLVIRRRRSS